MRRKRFLSVLLTFGFMAFGTAAAVYASEGVQDWQQKSQVQYHKLQEQQLQTQSRESQKDSQLQTQNRESQKDSQLQTQNWESQKDSQQKVSQEQSQGGQAKQELQAQQLTSRAAEESKEGPEEQQEKISERVKSADQSQSEETEKPLEAVVKEALAMETPDMESEVIQAFLKASDNYDKMSREEQSALSEETVKGIETVRERIAAVISSVDGITVSGNPWYVQLVAADGKDYSSKNNLLKEQYEGTNPNILFYKNISYVDVRTQAAYKPMTQITLTFPVPEKYSELENPMVLRYTGSEFIDLTPARNSDGNFYVGSARTLSTLLIADLPAALRGIRFDTETIKINRGQKRTLQVTAQPESTTEKYTLIWSSSKPSVATVSDKGVVNAVKMGTAYITAAVKEKPELSTVCQVTVMQGANVLKKSAEQVMEETKSYIVSIDKKPTVGSEWFVLGLARGGMNLKKNYFATYYNHTANYIEEKKGILTNSAKYTEYSKRVLSLTAMGMDARNVGGYNLFKYLSDFEDVKEQGLNGPIWALLAVNCSPEYDFPKNKKAETQTTKEVLIDYLLKSEIKGGGWALMGTKADSDITGMTLQALAPYYQKKGYEDVTAAIDRALEVLSEMQLDNGGYGTAYGGSAVETEESCAQVIVALCSLGIDPETDARFIKGGHWTVENLLSYHIDNSGFMHVKKGAENNGGGEAGKVNGMATEQGYYALVAYSRLKQGKTALYDMSDLTVKEGGKGNGQGIGLETPAPTATPTARPSVTATPGGSSGRLSNTTATPTPTGTVKAAAGSGESDTAKKSKSKKSGDGWDFDAEDWEEDSGGWAFDGESMPVDAEPEAGEIQEVSEKTDDFSIPPFVMGLLGGASAVLLLDIGKLIYKKYNRRK